VVVTGAGRGIGAHIAERFGHRGATVVLVDRDGGVKDTASALVDNGIKATGLVADVTSEIDVQAAFEEAESTLGRIDVLVNNAGIITISRIEDLTVDEWRRVLEVNTTGMFLCCKAVIGAMRRGGFGRILNAASGQARQGFIYTPHYAASKFGVVGLTQSLAKELARESITVNAFCPGIVATEMWSYNDEKWGSLLGNYEPGELMKKWIDEIPIGRAGSPDDIANLLLFLGSDAASYITGQTINIDGGMFMN
jgi:meso-butanediol dehydrogenase/(S,S)-butanediol dehydrogenase/diacetyl reductase